MGGGMIVIQKFYNQKDTLKNFDALIYRTKRNFY